MKKRACITAVFLLCAASGAFSAQTTITQIPALGSSASIKDLRDATNIRLTGLDNNDTDLYTNKVDKSCFANSTAFNACFALDWPTGFDTAGNYTVTGEWDFTGATVTGISVTGGITHATSDGAYYASKDGAWSSLTGVFAAPLGTDDNYVTDAEKTKLGNLSGTNTGDQDLSGYAATSSVLSKTNTTAFTPTADYHPSTKKYVDDSITASGGYTDEQAQDAAGAMFSGNTETGITVTYDDTTGKVNFVVPTALSGFSDDSTHRLVTDTEKSTWNAKQSALVAGTDYLTPTGSAAGLTSFPTLNQSTTGNAATSNALAANGTNCSSGQASLGVDASGNAEGCWTPSSGSAALPTCTTDTDTIEWDTTTSAWVCVHVTELTAGTGITIAAGVVSVTANTYQAYDADWLGVTPSGAAVASAANYAAMRGLLDLEAGTDFYSMSAANAAFQEADADLATYAGITPSANVQSLLGAADYAAIKTLLALVVGTNIQAYDADLTTWSGLTPGTDVGTFLTTPSSANLASAVTNETGSGALVFGTSPTLSSPVIQSKEVNGSTSKTLTSEEVSGTIVYNTGMGGADVTLTLPIAAYGYTALFDVGTAQSFKWGVRAGASDKIYLINADGTISAGTDNGYARMTNAQIGQSFACWTFKTDAYDWKCKAVSIGTSTFEAN